VRYTITNRHNEVLFSPFMVESPQCELQRRDLALGWESPGMVLRYTRSVEFGDSLRLYRKLEVPVNLNCQSVALNHSSHSKNNGQPVGLRYSW